MFLHPLKIIFALVVFQISALAVEVETDREGTYATSVDSHSNGYSSSKKDPLDQPILNDNVENFEELLEVLRERAHNVHGGEKSGSIDSDVIASLASELQKKLDTVAVDDSKKANSDTKRESAKVQKVIGNQNGVDSEEKILAGSNPIGKDADEIFGNDPIFEEESYVRASSTAKSKDPEQPKLMQTILDKGREWTLKFGRVAKINAQYYGKIGGEMAKKYGQKSWEMTKLASWKGLEYGKQYGALGLEKMKEFGNYSYRKSMAASKKAIDYFKGEKEANSMEKAAPKAMKTVDVNVNRRSSKDDGDGDSNNNNHNNNMKVEDAEKEHVDL